MSETRELKLWVVDDGEQYYVCAATIPEVLTVLAEAIDPDMEHLHIDEMPQAHAEKVIVDDDEELGKPTLWELFLHHVTAAGTPALLGCSEL